MSYEEEAQELKKWWKDKTEEIRKEMRENPVKGLDHPLEQKLYEVDKEFYEKLDALDRKYQEN